LEESYAVAHGGFDYAVVDCYALSFYAGCDAFAFVEFHDGYLVGDFRGEAFGR
jgi:hypothetical protein